MFVGNSFKIDLIVGIPHLGTDRYSENPRKPFWVENKTNYFYECLGQNWIYSKAL